MAEFKNITITVPIDLYERVERLAPRKKWGSNDVRDFHTRIFLQGVESAEFIKLENRRLATKVKLLESSLRQHQPQINTFALDSLARDLEVLQDMAAKQPEAKPVPESSPDSATAPEATVSSDKKSIVH